MAPRGRPGMSVAQKREVWRRWRVGQSLSEIGRALDKAPGSIHGVISYHGGIAPRWRERAVRTLTLAEREEISRALVSGESIRSVAARLQRAPSTVSREITRNAGPQQYRANEADERAWDRARRPKICHLARYPRLRHVVTQRLAADWSPAQIAGWLAMTYPEDPTMQLSHETIYRSLFLQARGVLKQELIRHLRRRRMMRHSRQTTTAEPYRGKIPGAISIRERPAAIADRAIPGHWEGDLLSGSQNTHIVTLVERQSRFVMLVRVTGKDTQTVVQALIRQVRRLPTGLRRSLTWDRGPELAEHQAFTVATNVAVYFCDPQSPWQRGTNENTNGLLRQYFPKKTNLAGFTQLQLDTIARKLNTRPRKTLGFQTPAAILAKALR